MSKLELDGEIYTILECNYGFEKRTDSTSKPSGETLGGEIELTIESRGKMNLVEWVLSPDKEKSGVIIFYRRDGMSKLFDIHFDKAYCIKFHEKFNSTGNEPMQITLTIAAKTLKFNNHIGYTRDWVII
ncbi:type VI secretion system tube protein TssD [Apibacter muscae]|nr:type VI secretion system tube protein TssD [Apibacter muscae]